MTEVGDVHDLLVSAAPGHFFSAQIQPELECFNDHIMVILLNVLHRLIPDLLNVALELLIPNKYRLVEGLKAETLHLLIVFALDRAENATHYELSLRLYGKVLSTVGQGLCQSLECHLSDHEVLLLQICRGSGPTDVSHCGMENLLDLWLGELNPVRHEICQVFECLQRCQSEVSILGIVGLLSGTGRHHLQKVVPQAARDLNECYYCKTGARSPDRTRLSAQVAKQLNQGCLDLPSNLLVDGEPIIG